MINSKLAKEKGLMSNNGLLYKELTKKYKYLLEYYLNSLIDLKMYEKKINDNDLYITRNIRHQSINEYIKLDYFDLVNNLFIEKLDLADIKLLQSFNKENVTNDLLEMIKRTYKEVIKDNYFKNQYVNDVYKVCYGNAIPSNFVNNNSLVFQFTFAFKSNEFKEKEIINLLKKQNLFINEQLNLLKKEIYNKLNINVEILIKK